MKVVADIAVACGSAGAIRDADKMEIETFKLTETCANPSFIWLL